MGYRTLLGESAWACLVVSVALHTTNICAVFVLIALQYGKGRRWMACCASSALIIALHPLCVEATCWASAQVRTRPIGVCPQHSLNAICGAAGRATRWRVCSACARWPRSCPLPTP